MATDTNFKLLDVLRNTLGPDLDATSKALVLALTERHYQMSKAADAAASTTTAFLGIAITDQKLKATSFKILPNAALTANDTDYATISLVYDDGAGGSTTTVGSLTTKTAGSGGTGNWTAGTAISMTLTAANVVIPSGSSIYVTIAKAASGVAVPLSTYSIKMTLETT